MFPDPITIVFNGVNKVLALVERLGKKGLYQNDDETFIMNIAHNTSNKGRVNSVTRLDMNAVVTDPISSETDQDTLSIRIVMERPVRGFTVTDGTRLKNALIGHMSDANFAKFWGQES